MKKFRILLVLIAAIVGPLLFLHSIEAQTTKSGQTIQNGSRVSIEYTLKDDKGLQIESNKGKDPLKYTHGDSEIIPGLENELVGMQVGDEKSIRVQPKDAYGEIIPAAFKEVPRENIPPGALKVGTMLMARTPQGRSMPVRVHKINEGTVVLDMNHPLAGKTLFFDVKIMDIEQSAKKE